jgi:hypothetical protein
MSESANFVAEKRREFMNALKATFDGGVFVPETRPRIPDGRTVLLSVRVCPREADDGNPSPSGDPYFLNRNNVKAILSSAEQARKGKTVPLDGDEDLQETFGSL